MTPLSECAARMEGHKVGLCLSGGKDSMATLHHLLPLAHMFTVYYMNPGDPDPYTLAMMADVADLVPKFVMITGNVLEDRARNGHPSDVVPTTMTRERAVAQPEVPKFYVQSTMSCCYKNLMLPAYGRMMADGVTMIIRGQKAADHCRNQLTHDGYVDEFHVEHFHPIEDETSESILAYLREKAPGFLHKWYEDGGSEGSIDCLSCTGWWNEIGEGYLERNYPEVLAFRRAVRAEVEREALAVLKWVC